MPESPQIHPFLANRWSTRLFDPAHELGETDLTRLLEAARWAPSAGNSQPWAFLVMRRGDAAHQKFVATLSRGNTGWVPTASAVLVSLYRAGDDDDPSLTFSDYAAYDLGQSVAHLTVQAESMGLAVHQFAGFDHAGLAAAFGVPASWAVTAGIAVGRHASPAQQAAADPALRDREHRPRVRKELTEFVFSEAFGHVRT